MLVLMITLFTSFMSLGLFILLAVCFTGRMFVIIIVIEQTIEWVTICFCLGTDDKQASSNFRN